MDLVIGWEPFATMWVEGQAMARAHFAEVEGDLEIKRPFKVDETAMRALNEAGVLRVLTARVGGELAAYFTWNIIADIESMGLLIGIQGAIYARDGFAGFNLTRRMLDFSIEELRAIGVGCLFLHHRLRGRGVRLDSLFRRRGAMRIKHEYFLWIGD